MVTFEKLMYSVWLLLLELCFWTVPFMYIVYIPGTMSSR